MKIIYKYQFEVTDKQAIFIPQGAEILCMQIQHDKPTIWVLTEKPFSRTECIYINTYPTGSPFNPEGEYIGTYQINSFVGHVFVERFI